MYNSTLSFFYRYTVFLVFLFNYFQTLYFRWGDISLLCILIYFKNAFTLFCFSSFLRNLYRPSSGCPL